MRYRGKSVLTNVWVSGGYVSGVVNGDFRHYIVSLADDSLAMVEVSGDSVGQFNGRGYLVKIDGREFVNVSDNVEVIPMDEYTGDDMIVKFDIFNMNGE